MANYTNKRRQGVGYESYYPQVLTVFLSFLVFNMIYFISLMSWAEEPKMSPLDGGAKLSYKSESEELVLRLSYKGGMIDDPDKYSIKVFGDGKVLIHRPHMMKDPGDWYVMLTEEELRKLLSPFADPDVLTLSNEQLDTLANEARKKTGPIKPPDDHGVATTLEIIADGVTPAGEKEPTMKKIEQKITARNLEFNARTLLQVQPIQKLAACCRKLEEIAKRSDLKIVQ
ncbi:MAG: hypothetical protein GY797_10375 [Deltaproteobacteria bacterium]|nr:hypothetical protein [Deltaproteobacteria bacterium]